MHDASLERSRALLNTEGFDASLHVGDFFAQPTPAQLGGSLPWMDTVVGNPPFVRYHDHRGQARKRSAAAALLVHACSFLKYRKNLKNRHEEAVGEVMSLRARHPMATMGYAYLVRRNVFDEEGAYAILRDILQRLRRPGEAFDATLLLVADWDEKAKPPQVTSIDQPATELGVSRFFEDTIHFVTDRSPIKEHVEVRRRRSPEPIGGLPDEDDPPDEADE